MYMYGKTKGPIQHYSDGTIMSRSIHDIVRRQLCEDRKPRRPIKNQFCFSSRKYITKILCVRYYLTNIKCNFQKFLTAVLLCNGS